jgi:predicted nucleotidyltransferase
MGLNDILNSFRIKDELNTYIWTDGEDGEYTMKPKVRNKMLQIANDFIESFNIPVVVSDIIMTGSLANYNWSEFSDIDIHIIVDFDQFEDDKKEVYEELFYLKKSIYNKNHNITIYSFDVELYVENEQEIKDVKSIGKFSILSNEWIEEPSKEKVDIDYNRIQQKSKKWMKGIDILIDTIEDEDYDTSTKLIDKYNNKLRKYRVSGLKSDGEYSDENLVFKTLRRNGYLEKLRNLKNELSDKYLTLKETQRIK